GGDRLVPIGVGHVLDAVNLADSGVQDADVDAAEMRQRGVASGANLGASTQVADDLPEPRLPEPGTVQGGDPEAPLAEQRSDCEPGAAVRSGDEEAAAHAPSAMSRASSPQTRTISDPEAPKRKRSLSSELPSTSFSRMQSGDISDVMSSSPETLSPMTRQKSTKFRGASHDFRSSLMRSAIRLSALGSRPAS